MYQRTPDLSTPLLEEDHQQNSTSGGSDDDRVVRTPAIAKRPRRDFDCTPKNKIRYLALYLSLSILLIYNGNMIEMLTKSPSTALGFSLLSLVIFLAMVLPSREWNRPAGTCFHPGTNLSSITATVQSKSTEDDRVQTPTFVLRKIMRDACNGICPRLKVIIFLLSISVLWATAFISVVYGITCILSPSGRTRYMLRHGLKQLVPIGNGG
mmetsp:Transcript_3321/g.9540  ORF Transcript_3321/g.9540 Transcript_3321/m.9540 type:complete len:210 (+) Transcript_3321:71-700(+)